MPKKRKSPAKRKGQDLPTAKTKQRVYGEPAVESPIEPHNIKTSDSTIPDQNVISTECYNGVIRVIDAKSYAAAGVSFCYFNDKNEIQFFLCKQERKEEVSFRQRYDVRSRNPKKKNIS